MRIFSIKISVSVFVSTESDIYPKIFPTQEYVCLSNANNFFMHGLCRRIEVARHSHIGNYI